MSANAWRTRSAAAGLPRADSASPRAGANSAGAPQRAQPLALAARVHPVAHQHEARRAHAAGAHGVQHDLRAGVVPGEHRSRSEHLVREATEHLGEPVERVRMARVILRVAVQRQIRQHDAEALGERLDGRFPLLVRQQPRVQQRERRPGAELAVGDARAVGVVVEAQAHTLIVSTASERT
jgi:hypothetical protein